MADEDLRDEERIDAQKQYLMAKVGELIDGVGPGYGKALMEELITRMERTVAHFHEEVTELLEALKSTAKERDQKLKSLLASGREEGVEMEGGDVLSSAEQEISEWEKKLEAKQERQQSEEEAKPEEEGTPKKRGMFGRKKKR
ncbi:MAG: hypothetical protein ACE5GH_03340 [Fidelibacterota bacterium]